MEFRGKYHGHVQVKLICPEPTKADQSQLAETDINNIMKKYGKTGVITHITEAMPMFGDVSQIGDYRESLDRILYAQDLFEALPATVRERFENDPAEFLEFMDNDKNYEEAVKLGLAIPKPEAQQKTPPQKNDDLNDDKSGKQPA